MSLIEVFARRCLLYRSSKVVHEAAEADLRSSALDAFRAGYKVTDLTHFAGFSRQHLYQLEKEAGAGNGRGDCGNGGGESDGGSAVAGH